MAEPARVTTKEMCYYCFDVLAAELKPGGSVARPEFTNAKYPLFVTWTSSAQARAGERPHLRGCIGNFSAMHLHSGLADYALQSALRDRRFSPIEGTELPHLHCAVSLLTDFEAGNDYLDWEVGKHGIWIEFELNGRKTTATYLPEVMVEQKWTQEEAIESLLRKGGYRGAKVSGEMKRAIALTRYQSQKESVSYAEWVSARNL